MGSGASSSAASPVAIHKMPSSTSQGAPHPLKQSKSFFQRLNPQPSLPIDPMENPYLLRLLSSYCPHSVLKLLGSKTITEPISETITGACLLADICGFTKFSGDLCQEGVSGLDKLRITTSSFLTKFIEIIYFYYGDVMAFAGDALICVFAPRPEDNNDPSQCCLRAVHCGNELKLLKTSTLSAHIAIDFGQGRLALIGGYDNQWAHIFDGTCFACLGNCINEAAYQELVISSALAKEIENCSDEDTKTLTFKRLSSGNYLIGTTGEASSSTSATLATSPNGSATMGLDLDQLVDEKLMKSLMVEKLRSEAFQSMNKQLCSFIPAPVLNSLAQLERFRSLDSLNSSSELRRVTCLFLKFDSYYAGYPLTQMQHSFYSWQEIILKFGGYIRQIVTDDKGCVVIALWGVPTASHVNNSIRALTAVATIASFCSENNYRVSMGLTTGDVYCGMIGSNSRCDYAAVGSSINFSARLMAKAKGKIYLDEATNYHLESSVTNCSIKLPLMCFKGKAEPVQIYQFLGQEFLSHSARTAPTYTNPFGATGGVIGGGGGDSNGSTPVGRGLSSAMSVTGSPMAFTFDDYLSPTAAAAAGGAGAGGGGNLFVPLPELTFIGVETMAKLHKAISYLLNWHGAIYLVSEEEEEEGGGRERSLFEGNSYLPQPSSIVMDGNDNCIQVIHVSGTTGTGKTEVANQMIHLCQLENKKAIAAAAAVAAANATGLSGKGSGKGAGTGTITGTMGIGKRTAVSGGSGGSSGAGNGAGSVDTLKTIFLSLTELDTMNPYYVIRQIVKKMIGEEIFENIKQQKQIITSLFYATYPSSLSSSLSSSSSTPHNRNGNGNGNSNGYHSSHSHQQDSSVSISLSLSSTQRKQQSLKQKFECLKNILGLTWTPPELAQRSSVTSRFSLSNLRLKLTGGAGAGGGGGGGGGASDIRSSLSQSQHSDLSPSLPHPNEFDWMDSDEDSIEIFATFFVTLLQRFRSTSSSLSSLSSLSSSSGMGMGMGIGSSASHSSLPPSLVIILDESQYCDPSSWSIIFHLLTHLKAPLIFLFTLTIPKKNPDDYSVQMTTDSDDYFPNSHSSKKANANAHAANANAVVPFLTSQVSNQFTNHSNSGDNSASVSASERRRNFSENAISSMDPSGGGGSSATAVHSSQRMKLLETLRYYSKLTTIKLHGLTKRQVRSLLESSLAHRSLISTKLVNVVTEICEGNVYWCKVIIEFIIQYGEESFCKTFCSIEETTTATTATTANLHLRSPVMSRLSASGCVMESFLSPSSSSSAPGGGAGAGGAGGGRGRGTRASGSLTSRDVSANENGNENSGGGGAVAMKTHPRLNELISMSHDDDDDSLPFTPTAQGGGGATGGGRGGGGTGAGGGGTGGGGGGTGGGGTGGGATGGGDGDDDPTVANSILYRLVTTLLDRLTYHEKEILKYASVCGAKFHSELLRLILPPPLIDQCEQILPSLLKYKFISSCRGRMNYAFISYRMRDIIYSLIPCSDAAAIHYLVAKQMEILYTNAHCLETFYEVITFHYIMASSSLFQLSKEEFVNETNHTNTQTQTQTQLIPSIATHNNTRSKATAPATAPATATGNGNGKSPKSSTSVTGFLSGLISPLASASVSSSSYSPPATTIRPQTTPSPPPTTSGVTATATGTAAAAAAATATTTAATAGVRSSSGGERERESDNENTVPRLLTRAAATGTAVTTEQQRKHATYSCYIQTIHEIVKKKSYEYSYLSCKLLYRLGEYPKALNYLKYASQEEAVDLLGDGYRQGMIRFLTNWLQQSTDEQQQQQQQQSRQGTSNSNRVSQRRRGSNPSVGGGGGASVRLSAGGAGAGSIRYSVRGAPVEQNGLMETYGSVSILLHSLRQM